MRHLEPCAIHVGPNLLGAGFQRPRRKDVVISQSLLRGCLPLTPERLLERRKQQDDRQRS